MQPTLLSKWEETKIQVIYIKTVWHVPKNKCKLIRCEVLTKVVGGKDDSPLLSDMHICCLYEASTIHALIKHATIASAKAQCVLLLFSQCSILSLPCRFFPCHPATSQIFRWSWRKMGHGAVLILHYTAEISLSLKQDDCAYFTASSFLCRKDTLT